MKEVVKVEHLGHRVLVRRRGLPGDEGLPRQARNRVCEETRRPRNRGRHRSAYRRTHTERTGERQRGEPRTRGIGGGAARFSGRFGYGRRTARGEDSEKALPESRRGGTRRRMLRTGCLFPYRPRMDKARILPADAAGHLSHGRRFGLFWFDVRHVRRPVHHSLDSHSHGADTAAETRNARRKSDCILHTADLRRGRLGHAALPEAPAVGIGLGGYRLWAGTHPALPAQSGSILHRTGRRHRSHRMFRRHHSRPVQRRNWSADGWYWKTSPASRALRPVSMPD